FTTTPAARQCKSHRAVSSSASSRSSSSRDGHRGRSGRPWRAGGCAMKYAVWFVRLVFAAWMIPAGLNHFVTLFPQPLGTQPLSRELFFALFDSHLFDLVKAVELVAGIGVLFGFYVPLSLVICMPVSFCVWYWDTPLE